MKERAAAMPDESGDPGFLDVAANALAIMLIVAVLILQTVTPPGVQGAPPPVRASDLTVAPRDDAALPPLSTYWIVGRHGFARLDLEPMVATLAAGRNRAQGPLGTLRMIPTRVVTKDYDRFAATFTADEAALARAAQPLDDPETAARFAEDARDRYDRNRISPTFLVRPQGIAQFVPAFHALRAQEVPFRWFVREEIEFSRKAGNFARATRRWQ